LLAISAVPALAQLPPATGAGAPAGQPSTAASVPASASVIVVVAPCASAAGASAAASKSCATELTRGDFEQLLAALAPNASAAERLNFAHGYAQGLGFAAEARARGLDKTPAYPDLVQMVTSQVLAQLLVRQVQQQSQQVPASEIETYYREHMPDYEEVSYTRLLIPRPSSQAGQPAPSETQEAAFARQLQTRWAAGENAAELQSEADKRAGRQPETPRSETRRRNALSAPQQALLKLSVGQVSDPLSEPGSFSIYKITGKQAQPLSAVKEEITRTLATARFKAEMEKLQSQITVKLNNDYFGATSPANGASAPPQLKR
jgi:hypothetical protein